MSSIKEIHDKHGPKEAWKVMWDNQITPWNMSSAAPALIDLLKQNVLPESGTFVVPGCGQRQNSLAISNNELEFIAADFFELSLPNPADVVFDYTFLCALDPSFRNQWASRMGSLIKPSGLLVTLMYPLSDHEGGPPFSLSIEIYKQLLEENFVLISLTDCESFEKRKGKEKLGIWKRK
ncbi:S-adenosyl-L-methionine-dependent methyltransferase [Rozella allomycis CSF55]|uniref:S-adenosyl-L-methionine-dependent methyltransferase n=1 Tax=Rozella allomycis (strain CSF55) TaxID=988480 RepID=A0A075AUC0_ROZAC|nr:TPMT family domain-containing protein [Rozella allomycis CSF55]RKP19435.1 S-adenosyl-L-methionine-dependent methyltransferase [Rozella allomycis CSF55]|eukprot:EPZ33868.1 TPMT family domain-containing protein [Rozella allomycis CSF55]